jgi:hypothetical protein
LALPIPETIRGCPIQMSHGSFHINKRLSLIRND